MAKMFKVQGTLLKNVIAGAVKKVSFGMADLELTAIYGVTATGESFLIESLNVEFVAAAPAQPVSGGRMRLVAKNGETL